MKFDGTSWIILGNAGISPDDCAAESLHGANEIPYVAFDSDGAPLAMKFNGTSWTNVGTEKLNNTGGTMSLYVYNGTPYVAFRDSINGYKATVKKFDGTNWVTVGNAGFSAATVDWLSISISNGIPYVGYDDWENGSSMIKPSVMKFSN